MNVPINILIGNAISLVAGLFIILSMWVNDEKQAYRYQFWNAFILAISSVFFFSWSGVITMGIAAAKNAVVYKVAKVIIIVAKFVVLKVKKWYNLVNTIFKRKKMIKTNEITEFLPPVGIIETSETIKESITETENTKKVVQEQVSVEYKDLF